MDLTRAAIQNNRTTCVLLIVVLIAGIQAYLSIPRAYDPGFIVRAAQVITYFPGASPERIEQLVSDKIEKVVQEIPELDFVYSESRTGVSIVVVHVKENYKNMRPIWDSLRRKIDKVASELPDGVIGPEVNDEFGDVFGIVLAVTGEGYNYAELKGIVDKTRDELLQLPDVAKVEIYGAQEERVFVEYNNARLAELNLSTAQLMQALSSRNIVTPGGSITLGNERIELEPSGNFESVDDVRRTIVQIPSSGRVIYLEDIAKVERGYVDPPSTKVHSTGRSALGLAIAMREGGNNITLGKQVKTLVSSLQSAHPIGVDFEIVNFSPREVEEKVSSFVASLVQAVAVVTAVMLLSLGLRTGLVVASLIPASMIMAILVMSQLNIGLDQISLAALIIALGMLVDNGIVMSENIMVQMAAGTQPTEAAIKSARELRFPLLTASLTTAAAFLPIYLAESATGEFTASLFKVVTITLLCSWILSLTVIPMLCAYFLKVKQQETTFTGLFYNVYRQVLHTLLRFRWLTLTLVSVLFVIALYGFQYVPKIFFPDSDRTYFKLELKLPLGTDINYTESVVRDIEAYIQSQLTTNASEQSQGITHWASYIGSGGPRFVLTHNPEPISANYALLILNTDSADVIGELMTNLHSFTFERFPDLEVKIRRIETGAPIENPVEVRVSGNDTDRLFAIVDDIKTKMSEISGLRNISDDWGQRIKKLRVKVDQTRAFRAGITSEDVAISLQTGLSGIELTQYREGDNVIPVMLRSVAADRQDIGKIEALTVYAQATGLSVPLRQVADIEIAWEPAKILRRDRVRTVTVGAQLVPGFTANEAFTQLEPWLEQEALGWNVGYRYAFGGEAETSSKANESIAVKLPIAAAIITLLLVGQFNSLRKTLIILMTIPLGVTGVIYGLLITNSYFGFMTLLGIISLAGIVINNAIVLLERIKLEIDVNGLSAQHAIIMAAQRRTRPILLTTATTVLGLIPLYLGGGEMWEPMVIAIIAGLLFSTILTLGIVPVLYSLLFRVSYKDFKW